MEGFIRHRYELVRESTRRKNKLTAICDEVFPELTKVLKDPHLPTALSIREHFPTPHAVATASILALKDARGPERHSVTDAKLLELQQLATQSIGTKDLTRQRGLLLEQGQLIKELRLLQEHIAQLENEILTVVGQAREGQIISSMGIGPVQTATIIAAIGHIDNFPKAGTLKAYFGWAPVREQTGTTLDRASLTAGGTRVMRQTMYLVVENMICQKESAWSHLYERLVQTRCPYDARLGKRTGKIRVMGRVAGQMIETMYALLKTDAELLSKVPPGKEPPPPTLYDPQLHRQHREGHYRPLKSSPRPTVLTLLPHA